MIAFYRALLRLYPSSFRAEYEAELCEMFEDRLRKTSRTRAILGAIADVVPNALAAHFDILRQDLRYAVRTLRRVPGFAFTVIAIVALGIGANTAAFSLANFVLLRPLPYPHSEQLVNLWGTTDGDQNEVSPPNYRDWKAMATKSFSGMAAYVNAGVNLSGEGMPRRVQTVLVTPELLPLIGTKPLIGSTEPLREGASTAMLSHDLWQSQFAGNPRVVGRVVRLEGKPFTIVGVMPASFRFPSRDTELWTPLTIGREDNEDRSNTFFHVVGRLRPNATFAGARAELATIAKRLERQYPDTNEKLGVWLVPLHEQIGRQPRLLLIALCGASFCILLLACANLASLLLARGANRSRELAIRNALGAGRERLVRQLITETIVLAVIGGAIGVLLAWKGLPLFTQLVPTSLPIEETPTVDWRVLLFAGLLMLLTSLGFGVIPALREQTFMTRQRIRSALVIIEVTGSIVLLIASGLLMRAIWRVQSIEPGFRAEDVMTLETSLPLPKYETVASRESFYKRVLDDVRAIPGVKSAAYVTGLPMVRTGGIWKAEVPGAPEDQDNFASLRYVTPGYFATMGIPRLRGRDIADADTQKSPYVAVVSESMVKKYWPGQDPMGRRFKFALAERTVVGVVGDVRVRGRERESEPQIYLASSQVEDNGIIGYIPRVLVIRSTLPAQRWLPSVQKIVLAADPEQPVSSVHAMSEIEAKDTAPRRVQLSVLTLLTAIALLIAGVGIHGLLSFTISQRTKELGVRRALGAQTTGVVGIVLREGFRLAALGMVLGLVLALFVARSMQALLFGIPPTDVRTFAAAATLCVITALLGCLPPAIRAARIDPWLALRES